MLHVPKQSRSRKTLERILAAARSLMSEGGVDGVGITQIVAEANSSVGSFYARFDGKEDLIRHLHERLWQEARSRWAQGVAEWRTEGPTEERVDRLVGLIVEAVGPDHALRSSLTHVLGDDGATALGAFDAQVTEDGSALFQGDRSIRHPNPDRGLPVGIRMSLSTFRDHLARPPGNGSSSLPTVEELEEELSVALRGYWGVGRVVQAPGPSTDTAVEYFDIWS